MTPTTPLFLKGCLLPFKTRPFTRQKVTFCNVKGNLFVYYPILKLRHAATMVFRKSVTCSRNRHKRLHYIRLSPYAGIAVNGMRRQSVSLTIKPDQLFHRTLYDLDQFKSFKNGGTFKLPAVIKCYTADSPYGQLAASVKFDVASEEVSEIIHDKIFQSFIIKVVMDKHRKARKKPVCHRFPVHLVYYCRHRLSDSPPLNSAFTKSLPKTAPLPSSPSM